MAKSATARSSLSGQFVSKQSTKAELDTFQTVVSRLKKDPIRLREVAVRAGISTPTGKLKKAYGGR